MPAPAKAKLPVLWNVPFVMALRVGVDGPKSTIPVPLLTPLPLMLPLPPPPLPLLPETPPRRDSCGEYVGASALWIQSETQGSKDRWTHGVELKTYGRRKQSGRREKK